MGTQPRSFNERDQETLADLGALATELLDLRRRVGSGPKQSDDRPLSPDEVMRAGRIVYNNGRLQIRCTVRDHSKAGATAQVMTTAKIPERVALILDSNMESRLCTVTSRSEKVLSLAFES
jgi:hypothetical protein